MSMIVINPDKLAYFQNTENRHFYLIVPEASSHYFQLLPSKIYSQTQIILSDNFLDIDDILLNKLERYGFVIRESFPVLPLKVEYKLTTLGMELSVILNTLTIWTEANMKKITAAEKNFVRSNVNS